MDGIVQDVRYALRVLRKSPGFTTVSILTLALGIVGTTLVFNAYNATMWAPLPAKEPQRLAILDRRLVRGGQTPQFSIDEYRRLSAGSRLLSGVAGEGSYETVLGQLPILATGKLDEPRQTLIKSVSGNYFDVLGVDASAGRVFHGSDKLSSAPIAVLSYSSWHRRFRNDPAILGKAVVIYGVAVTIVGITPQDFVGSGGPPIAPDFWVPMSAEAVIEPQRQARSGNEPWLRVFGRLAPGATKTQVESELTALEQQHEREIGLKPRTASIVAGPAFYFVEPNNPAFRAMAALLLASFSMVLLVACANMANFFMARATRRRREMAVRSALGASRVRLLRQLMTEGIVIGLGAGTVSVVASAWICELVWVEVEQRMISRFTDLYYFNFNFVPSWRVLVATCVVSVLAGALFSLAGAVQSSRVDLNEVIKGCELTIATGRRVRVTMRDLLIGVQVTLSVMLLTSAAVLARGMVRGQSADPGFHTSDVLDIEFDGLSSAGFDATRSAALREQLQARMTAIGGVKQVAFASHVPLLGEGAADIRRPGGETHRALDNDISPGFFETLGIPVVRGRDFTASEIAQRAPVVIVSQATARNLWPGEDAVGKFVEVGNAGRARQVIGVAQDVHTVNLGSIEPFFLYLPLAPDAPLDDVMIRTTGDARRAIPDGLKAAADVDHRLASLAVAHSLDDALWFQRVPSLVATILAAVVGSLALILATVGIYGTIAYAVAQRTREIGIRMALGAPSLSIIRLVLARTMALVGAGAAIGLVGAAAVSHAVAAVPFGLQSMLLFGTSPRDPASFAAVAVFLLLVAFVAGYRPAMRATKVDPMVALRYE